MSVRLDTSLKLPGGQKRLRVLVVEDSSTQRGLLVAILEAEHDMEVVGFAATGGEAVRLATALKPDIITMDLRLPDIDGLEATRRIMENAPTRIIVVTAHALKSDSQAVSAARDAGALALVEKPGLARGSQGQIDELLRTLRGMARIRVVRRRAVRPPDRPARHSGESPEVVVVGASTGGPAALQAILGALPATFPLPILIVQHIAAGFTEGMIEWLRPLCALPVQLATSGTPVPSHGVFVAPNGLHLVVRNRVMTLIDEPPVRGHRPSATLLFRSVAEEYGSRAVGVLLTGMGDDGASGLKDLKRLGARTIAQDEASSVVFGMPGAAIGMGAVDYVLPPADIARVLGDLGASSRGA